MKKMLFASSLLVVSGFSASAADLPARVKPVVPAPVINAINWSGLYIGAQAGWAQSQDRQREGDPWDGYGARINTNGVLGGAHIGYDHQIGMFVVGALADFNFSGAKKSGFQYNNYDPAQLDTSYALSDRLNWQSSFRMRAGVIFGQVLAYATGGASLASFERTFFDAAPGTGEAKFRQTHGGWTIGGGGEYRLSNNWSLKAEYLYSKYGNTRQDTTVLNSYCCGQRSVLDAHTATIGVSYRFGAPSAPVVAKY